MIQLNLSQGGCGTISTINLQLWATVARPMFTNTFSKRPDNRQLGIPEGQTHALVSTIACQLE